MSQAEAVALGEAGGKPFSGLRVGIYSPWFDDCDPEVREEDTLCG